MEELGGVGPRRDAQPPAGANQGRPSGSTPTIFCGMMPGNPAVPENTVAASAQLLKCPHCSAPLSPPSRFARSVVCAFCAATVTLDHSAVSAARFREAHARWSSPATHGFAAWWSIGTGHWAVGALAGRGEASDVYFGLRARWPTERVLVKVLRSERAEDVGALSHEREVLEALQDSTAPGAASLTRRIPEPVAHGLVRGGPYEGRCALVLRHASGFHHTLEAVRARHSRGVDPRASVWMWRRILEVLTFVHASGWVHGAVLPQHLLIQDGEHGVRLVGYAAADRPGRALRRIASGYEPYYPQGRSGVLSPALDVAMSARCIAYALGGDPATGEVPAAVPPPYASLIRSAAAGIDADEGAWALRDRIGSVSAEVFGPPSFHPIEMPAVNAGHG